jgi:hypothetical protein
MIFSKKTSKNLSLPSKKFLRDGFIGLLRAGQPVVCQMSREAPNQGPKYTTSPCSPRCVAAGCRTGAAGRVKRLDLHLTAESDFDQRIKQSLPNIWVPLVTDDTLLILDLSDPAKPLATQMDYLATVRDGSTGKLRMTQRMSNLEYRIMNVEF